MRKRRKSTIGENPLDAVIPRRGAAVVEDEGEEPKERMTFYVPVSVGERLRNAVYWSPGLTLTDIACDALAAAADKVEKRNGGPFPTRKSDLKGGRPMK